jgi:hypothetical protein
MILGLHPEADMDRITVLAVTGLIDPDPNVQDRLWLQVLVEGEKV